MNNVINIGRDQSNDLVFDYQQISGKHAIITSIAPNSLLLEDLSSTNGTFVNGIRVQRMIINQKDRVKMANILVDTKPYFTSNELLQQQGLIIDKTPVKEENQQQQFEKLQDIWDTYQNVKLNHKKKDFWKNLGMSAAGLGVGAIITAATGGTAGLMMVGSLLGRGASGFLKKDEKLQVVENEFKVNYVCPKCKDFVGYKPYEALVQQGKCFRCKAKWN